MKHMLWILLLSSAAQAATCSAAMAKDGEALVELEHQWALALEHHDAATLGCILAEEFEDANPDGQLADRAATLAKTNVGQTIHHELSEMHAHVRGDFGYIRGLATAQNPQTKIVTKVRFTDIYVYRDGRWQCVAGHESLVYAMSH